MSAVTAGDVLTLDELRDLRRTSSLRGALLVLHAWVVIAGAMTVYAVWPSALTLIAAIVVIGSRQLGLAVLMHDAAHWLLSPKQRVNTWVATWLCAGPICNDIRSYRREHHLHHRHTRQPDDPEMAPAWRPWRVTASRGWRWLIAPLASNVALFVVLAAAGQWHLYPLLWLLPLVTWYRLVAWVRSIAEHALVLDDDDPLRNARTTAAGWLARAFLAPYWVNYHVAHHLLVFVPCWKLRRAHALMLAKGYGPSMELAPSYLAVMRRVTSGAAVRAS